jgi:signal transduction histidine kinase
MYFFKEIKDYIGFSDEDADCLRRLNPLLEPYFEDIVDHFYRSLNDNARTRDIFTGLEQIERLRKTLHRWLTEVFAGAYDDAYFHARQRIGRIHVAVGLQPQFMFGAMNIIRIDLIRAIYEQHDRLEAQVGRSGQECIESVERILDLELTIMTQAYWDKLMQMKLEIPSALATGLAHEIRNPLNTMGLQLTLLDRRIRDIANGIDGAEERISPIADALRSELARIRTLTNDIMDFSKPVEISPAWHDAGAFLEELERVHGPSLEASNIAMETRLEGDLRMWCDMDRMRQLVVNLLTNAVEAMDESGRIAVSVDNADYGTTLTFEDAGEGMAPALKYRVFDLFFTTKPSGTGMGLPIIKKIVEAHGGSIDVSSQPGRGTKFTIFLPRPEFRE